MTTYRITHDLNTFDREVEELTGLLARDVFAKGAVRHVNEHTEFGLIRTTITEYIHDNRIRCERVITRDQHGTLYDIYYSIKSLNEEEQTL